MKEILLNSVDDIHSILNKYRKSSQFKFRGQSIINWLLIPKAGRSPFNNVKDENQFNHWKRRGIHYLENKNYTDWDFLSISQQTGLATRLLDWSHNPLTAVFFASVDNVDYDGALYVYKPNHAVLPSTVGPFDLKKDKIYFYAPITSSNRIANQLGYYTIHSPPDLPLNDETKDGVLEKIIIRKELKKNLTFLLHHYGVNYLSLFPDLEGLSKHICWFATNYNFWDSKDE